MIKTKIVIENKVKKLPKHLVAKVAHQQTITTEELKWGPEGFKRNKVNGGS